MGRATDSATASVSGQGVESRRSGIRSLALFHDVDVGDPTNPVLGVVGRIDDALHPWLTDILPRRPRQPHRRRVLAQDPRCLLVGIEPLLRVAFAITLL